MRRTLALSALVAVATAGGSTAGTRSGHQLYGIVGGNHDAQLAVLHPETLRPLSGHGRPVRLRTFGRWSFSPGGSHVAISTSVPMAGTAAHPVSIRVIDLRSMRRVMNLRLGPDPRRVASGMEPVVALAWLTPTRIVAVRQPRPSVFETVVIDTARRVVVHRSPLDGYLLDAVSTRHELVVLIGEYASIVAPRVVTIGADGSRRSLALDAIRAGWTATGEGEAIVSHSISPALAIDRVTRTAYVVAPSGTIATLTLEPLAVSYRSIGGRYAKLYEGAHRSAGVVRSGLLAIAGSESSVVVRAGGEPHTLTRPTGLELVDATTWSTTRVDPRATAVSVADGNVLATGWWWAPPREDIVGMGLAAYRPDGSVRFRVFDGHAVTVAGVLHGRAYVHVDGTGETTVIDLATGAVRGRRLGYRPLLLDPRG